MKVLFDCILTAVPGKCSSNAQFVVLAELLLKNEDTYIYWPLPDWVTAEEMLDYPVSDRIKYIPAPQSKDRMREYNRISPALEKMLAFDGSSWDWDVLVTVRTAQVPMMRVICTSPRAVGRRDWSKKIIVIEDMMILSLKPTVIQSNEPVQDRMTIEGYFAADIVLMPAYHQKAWVQSIAKQHFSAARVRELDGKIREVCHLRMDSYALKTEHVYKGETKMNVAFVGRLERVNARLDTINEILSSQFIFHGPKVHPFICTVSPEGSPGEAKIDLGAVDILRPNRKEFWQISKEKMDLAVFFHIDVELNMSMLEPLSFGVPVIVKKAPWSIGMLGNRYPFFVDNATQAYGFVNAFAEDYAKQYEIFSEWYTNWFLPTYERRVTEDSLYEHLLKEIYEPVPDMHLKLGVSGRGNEVVKLLNKHGGEDLRILELIKQLGTTHLRTLAGKAANTKELGLIWAANWNDTRLALKTFYGFEDAGTDLGHLKRKLKALNEVPAAP
jgi:hypothetical protein